MIRLIALATTFLMAYLFYGFYISTHKFHVADKTISFDNSSDYFDYKGVLHSHSSLSTGIGPPEELIQAALSTGFDFLFITDSNTFDHAYELEGYHQNLLVYVYEEFDYLDSRFLHISRQRTEPFQSQGDVQVRFADILSNRASKRTDEFLILTHPKLKGYEWNRAIPPGLTSIEVLNLKSIWHNTWKESAFYGIWSVFVYPFNPELALLRLYSSPTREMHMWDKMSETQPTIGFFGHDATARALPFKGVPIRFPSYESIFRMGGMHVWLKSELTGNSHTDRERILSALQNGNSYMSLDLLGDPEGFLTRLISSSESHLPGAEVPLRDDYLIEVQVPHTTERSFQVRFIRNGQTIHLSTSHLSRMNISEPGNYRVEVWVNAPLPFPDQGRQMIWIASNPFFIR